MAGIDASPPMTTTARLAGLSDLLTRASALPWSRDLQFVRSVGGIDILQAMRKGPGSWNKAMANATLATAAVNALPELLARIAALEDHLDQIKEAYLGNENAFVMYEIARAALTLKDNDCG